jgi:WXXGXW repeat (2 copies)
MKKIRSHFLVFFALLLPAWSMAQFSLNVSVNVAPPELPVYDQPPIPGDGYVWTPGFWAWSDDDQDYYWVPGTWIAAPQPGFLWTPGYWGFNNGVYLWNGGYWGPVVGFYGGVNYGYGYGGNGYEGGYWQGGHLFYNRSVTNINNVHITNVYNKTVINNVTVNHVSFNGGNGIQARPTEAQMAAAHDHHIEATSEQRQQVNLAHSNPSLRASQNHGRPPIAATSRPGSFSGAGVVPARQAGGPVHQNEAARTMQPEQRNPPAQHTAPVQQRSAPVEPQRNEAPPQRNEAPVQRNEAPREAPRVENQGRPAAPPPAQHPAPHPEQHAAPEHDDHEHH